MKHFACWQDLMMIGWLVNTSNIVHEWSKTMLMIVFMLGNGIKEWSPWLTTDTSNSWAFRTVDPWWYPKWMCCFWRSLKFYKIVAPGDRTDGKGSFYTLIPFPPDDGWFSCSCVSEFVVICACVCVFPLIVSVIKHNQSWINVSQAP